MNLFFAFSPAAAAAGGADGNPLMKSGAWNELILRLPPFAMNLTVLMKSESFTMEQFARMRLEFPDARHVFQRVDMAQPFKITYLTFTSGGHTVLHDIGIDNITYVPTARSPVAVFSIGGAAETFLPRLKFEDVEPETVDNKKVYVFKVSSAPVTLGPGQEFEEIKGHLWIDAGDGKPVKMILTGRTRMTPEESAPVSILADFDYSGMALPREEWKTLDRAVVFFRGGNETKGKALIREMERALRRGAGTAKTKKQ